MSLCAALQTSRFWHGPPITPVGRESTTRRSGLLAWWRPMNTVCSKRAKLPEATGKPSSPTAKSNASVVIWSWNPALNSADAANDAHAAWVLYHKLFCMLPNLPKPAEPWYYTFDYHDERFWIPDGRPWVAINPDYDAGPPPPPRPPRVQRERAPREEGTTDERPARREVPPVDNFVPYRRGPRGTRIYLIPGESPPPKPVGPILPERFRRANVPTYASVSAQAHRVGQSSRSAEQPRHNQRRGRRPHQHGTPAENPAG